MSSGILLIDKPGGITSHDAVARVRKLAGTRKVGHAGTLDPMATGLMILGLNSSTRLLTYVVGQDKEYLATIRLGQRSTTDDAEGELTPSTTPEAVGRVTDAAIDRGIAALTGEIDQIPSSVSAIKVNGKRAYALVRAGEQVELAARSVTVSEFEVLDRRSGDGTIDLDVRVSCSSGTYIRALARDLGDDLGVGGHLTALRRTRIGPFAVSDAHGFDTLDAVAHLIDAPTAASAIFSRLELSEAQSIDLSHGKRIDADDLEHGQEAGPFAAIAPDGHLVGLVEVRNGQAKSIVNFPQDEHRQAGENGAASTGAANTETSAP